MLWNPGIKARRVGQMKKITDLVTHGKLTDGLDLFRQLPTLEQSLMKENIAGALRDCALFLTPAENYRGDHTTWARISVLKYSYDFARDIGVSNPELDELIATHNRFDPNKFYEALNKVQTGEKVLPIKKFISEMTPESPLSTSTSEPE